MASSLTEIAGFLEKGSFVFDLKEEDNSIITLSPMNNYIDQGGDYILPIVILLQEDGRFIRISAPNCYAYKNAETGPELFQIILVLSFHCKMLQFECDRMEETLSAVVEFPLEDSPLTEKQLLRCINSMSQMVDRFDPWIRLVLSNGRSLSGREIKLRDQTEQVPSVMSFLKAIKGEGFGLEKEQESDEEWI